MQQSHLHFGLAIFMYCFALLAAAPVAHGAEEPPVISADSASFREVYDPAVPVSGSAIVGIRLGDPNGNIRVGDIRLPILPGEAVCVRAVTQDGRFSSNNLYKAAAPLPPGSAARLSPVTLRYSHILSGYKMDAFALKAFASTDGSCTPNGAVHLPQLLPQEGPTRKLAVLVNSGGRYTAMQIAGTPKSPCSNTSGGARIAFDKQCIADISAMPAGTTDIRIIMDDGFGEETTVVSVMIPPSGL